MENNGLLNVTICLVKKDETLARKILEARGWGEDKLEYVLACLKYNVLTVRQFCELTGFTQSTVDYHTTSKMRINEKTRIKEMRTLLDFCYPFPNSDGPGQKYIVRNEKCEKYLGK